MNLPPSPLSIILIEIAGLLRLCPIAQFSFPSALTRNIRPRFAKDVDTLGLGKHDSESHTSGT